MHSSKAIRKVQLSRGTARAAAPLCWLAWTVVSFLVAPEGEEWSLFGVNAAFVPVAEPSVVTNDVSALLPYNEVEPSVDFEPKSTYLELSVGLRLPHLRVSCWGTTFPALEVTPSFSFLVVEVLVPEVDEVVCCNLVSSHFALIFMELTKVTNDSASKRNTQVFIFMR